MQEQNGDGVGLKGVAEGGLASQLEGLFDRFDDSHVLGVLGIQIAGQGLCDTFRVDCCVLQLEVDSFSRVASVDHLDKDLLGVLSGADNPVQGIKTTIGSIDLEDGISTYVLFV